ncbi:sigma-70 family RNA polymerase sigma factor [Kitasatospora sp. DSM 101779]|uniref:sigma-70 family RNA polymerase sigma factor n=1 Tax=Kitasatospora sp. DSM 101779 TaxID=2853165 RepID=UPI0021D89594|nr:sigma-70 family RNA polymerase sigma factor [Kitasatospora sp. DSM 101779]MCU7824861.1 sigma-70 family RNA polymerase sigma factor [Kitasatospora sp. DSM 101779]
MTDTDAALADPFETHRRYLGAVAYRLLGSVADAEDVLQEAWLRWQSADRAAVAEPRAFLSTVVTRLCYDQLGSARVRREEYYGEWLPEPLVADESSPADLAELGESVSMAVLTLMEQLSPAERAAFVLHDIFSVGFDEIAATLERSPEAARQLASRARRRVKDGSRRSTVDPAEHRQAVSAFAAATAGGDLQALLAVLDPDVVWHSDGGGVVSAGVRPIVGADRVSRLVAGLVAKFMTAEATVAFAQVNGELGLVIHSSPGVVAGVIAFTVTDGRIAEAYVVVNPEKLTHVK